MVRSNGLFHRPLERSQAETRFALIELVECFHDGGGSVVFHHRKDCTRQGRPCVGAVMRLSGVRAPTLHCSEGGESPTVVTAEKVDNQLMVSLVVCYKNCFHL